MKKGLVILLSIVILTGCFNNKIGKCSSCMEYEEIAGSCPCCDAPLCKLCLPDVEDEFENVLESRYFSGTEDGYDEGYDDGYKQGYFNGFDEGLEIGFDDGYDSAMSDDPEINFWRSYAVIVTSTGKKYHTYDCYHIDGRPFNIFNIASAKAQGYTACLDCIDW